MWKHRQAALSATVLTVSVLLALVVAELGLRAVDFRSAVLDANMFEATNDELMPYVLRPDYRGYFAGGKVTIASDGNRVVPPLSLTIGHENEELVLLGDSVVFGQGLDDEHTIGANIQKQLLSQKIRVAMIGAPGYSTWNEYRALLRYKKLSKVKTVVLVYIGNDVTFDNDYFKLREAEGRIIFMQTSLWHKFLHVAYHNSRLSFAVADSVKRLTGTRRASPIYGVDEAALAYSMGAIARIRDECAMRGIDLIVAIHRDGFFYHDRKGAEEYERKISLALEANAVDYFILRLAADKLDYYKFALSWNDGHPSARASELIAEEIVSQLARRRARADAVRG